MGVEKRWREVEKDVEVERKRKGGIVEEESGEGNRRREE